MQAYLPYLDFYDQVEYSVIKETIAWLCTDPKLHVLDAGCGEGLPALVFAEQGCSVIGIDIENESLGKARQLLAKTPFVEQVTFLEDNLLDLPFEHETFDLVWTSYVLHHVADKLAAVRELQRVLKPGGRLAIREGGLPLYSLPYDFGLGEPGLEHRLRDAENRWFAAMTRDTLPNEVYYPFGWSQLLIDTGFTDIKARTFTLDLLSPFDDAQAEFILYRFRRVLERDQGQYGPFLSQVDQDVLQQLLDPASHFFILKRLDLHVRYGLSVYTGTKLRL
jgi:ubiquinone/menaquinone biosynthesis C-methylase UbiE